MIFLWMSLSLSLSLDTYVRKRKTWHFIQAAARNHLVRLSFVTDKYRFVRVLYIENWP